MTIRRPRHHPTPERGRRALYEHAWILLALIAVGIFVIPGRLNTPPAWTGWFIASCATAVGAMVVWFLGRWLGHRQVQAADYRLCLCCRGSLDMQGDAGHCRACGREYTRVSLVWCWSNTYALGGGSEDDEPWSGGD